MSESSQGASTRDAQKRAAALAALDYIREAEVLGVGTGSTVAHFIDAVRESRIRPRMTVATSTDTLARLEHVGMPVVSLAEVDSVDVYVDSADEVDPVGRLIKGAGGASTMEKIVAAASRQFVCIVDESKMVERLGEHAALPIEVLSPAIGLVMKRLEALGGAPKLRAGHETDLGNPIIDVVGLDLADPACVEQRIDAIPGVVECGLFAARRADVVIVGLSDGGTRTLAMASG